MEKLKIQSFEGKYIYAIFKKKHNFKVWFGYESIVSCSWEDHCW